jgi:chlorophyll synthase
VTLGPEKAAKVACIVMLVPQVFVILALAKWGQSTHASIVLALVLGQIWAMSVMLKDPKAKAPWYNATGVLMYVSGMMVSAFALRAVGVI